MSDQPRLHPITPFHQSDACKNAKMVIVRVFMTSELKLRISGHCPKCKTPLNVDYTLGELGRLAPNPPEVPISVDGGTLTEKDLTWLRSMGK